LRALLYLASGVADGSSALKRASGPRSRPQAIFCLSGGNLCRLFFCYFNDFVAARSFIERSIVYLQLLSEY